MSKYSIYRLSPVILFPMLMILPFRIPAFFQGGTQPADRDIAVILGRLKAQYINKDFSHAHEYLASQASDGSWQDIKYSDRSVQWDPQKHLDRLAVMAVADQNAKSPDHGSAAMLQGIEKGLQFWYQGRPQSDSWWSNEIGQQLALEQILTLMDGSLPPETMSRGADSLHDPVQEAALKPTGENLVWFAGEQFVRGVLKRAPNDITSAISTIEATTVVTTDEGIQPDHSFHQHGPQLYVGGYGLQFLKDAFTYARLTDGTRFAYSPEALKALSDCLLGGARFMTRGQMLDYGAIGREISRPGAGREAVGLIPICDSLSAIRPDVKPDCDSLEADIKTNGQTPSFVGNRFFWNSDFEAHQRNGYYTSVKLASNRTYGTEKVNNENLKGYWIPFGTNYILRRGDEYLDIFPAWNWAHLPGVTSPDEVPRFLSHVDQKGDFSGGVSDGIYGAAAMRVDLPVAPSLHAYKAWFFFDREFVALGAGISSSDNPDVNTTLNQTLHRGDVLADGRPVPPGEHVLSGVSWILHDGIGYLFPKKGSAYVSTGPHTGSWADINALQPNTPVTKDIFQLWISDGSRPVDATYEYIVVPDTDASALSTYSASIPVQILSNSKSVQAVRHSNLGISDIIFYAPGRVTLHEGLSVSVDQACMMLVEEKGQSAKVGVGAPRGPLNIHVTFSTGRGEKTATFTPRGGPSLGATVIQNIDF